MSLKYRNGEDEENLFDQVKMQATQIATQHDLDYQEALRQSMAEEIRRVEEQQLLQAQFEAQMNAETQQMEHDDGQGHFHQQSYEDYGILSDDDEDDVQENDEDGDEDKDMGDVDGAVEDKHVDDYDYEKGDAEDRGPKDIDVQWCCAICRTEYSTGYKKDAPRYKTCYKTSYCPRCFHEDGTPIEPEIIEVF